MNDGNDHWLLHIDEKPEEKPTKGERVVLCTVITRIVGYLSETFKWNPGKLQEFEERQVYDVNLMTERARQL